MSDLQVTVNNTSNNIEGSVSNTDNLSVNVVTARNLDAHLTPQNNVLVTNYRINYPNLKMEDFFDIDGSELADGAVLIYNKALAIWKATPIMQNSNTTIDGGNY